MLLIKSTVFVRGKFCYPLLQLTAKVKKPLKLHRLVFLSLFSDEFTDARVRIDNLLAMTGKEEIEMSGGYMKKILFVNLSNGEMREEVLDDSTCRDYIGGYGLGARILYSRQKPDIDPLGPENILGFITGPLTGNLVPTGARYAVVWPNFP